MQKLTQLSNLYFSLPTPTFKRYLYTQIDFKSKLIGILGQRGVGKTVLIENSKVDLSRRALFYKLHSLSFREFIAIKYDINLPVLKLDDILTSHQDIASQIKKQFKPLEYFKYYQEFGAYPFFTEGELGYNLRLNEIMNIILDSEVATIYNVDSDKINTIRKLLHLLCASVPVELNIQNLASQSEISRNTLYSYLYYLQKANLIEIIGGNFKNKKLLNKPDKIYLENVNLYNILCSDKNIGSIRESFFISQMKINHDIKYSKIGDFIVDDKFIFEVGGKNTGFNQIKDVPNSFVVSDDTEMGFGNKLPLWLFGFLY